MSDNVFTTKIKKNDFATKMDQYLQAKEELEQIKKQSEQPGYRNFYALNSAYSKYAATKRALGTFIVDLIDDGMIAEIIFN